MGVAVVVALPEGLAAEFPHLDEGGVGHRPHVTVLYLREAKLGDVVDVVRDTVAARDPFPLELTGGLHYFDPSPSSEGRKVAVAAVQSDGLGALRSALILALEAAGVDVSQSHPGYVPHATLAYLPPDQSFDGAVPLGVLDVYEVEVWDGDQIVALPFHPVGDTVQLADPLGEPHDLPVAQGLVPGRWLRIASVGPIHCRLSGKKLWDVDEAQLQALATWVNSQARRSPVIIDWNHDGVSHGEVVGARLATDERGVGLEIAPAYNRTGFEAVRKHMPSLWTSPDIVKPKGPGGHDKGTGRPVAPYVLRAVSLTNRPRSLADAIDRVRLAEPTHNEPADGGEVQTMITQEEFDALKAELEAKTKQLEDAMAELAKLRSDSEADGGADGGNSNEATQAAQLAESIVKDLRAENVKLSEEIAGLKARESERTFQVQLAEAHNAGYPTTPEAIDRARKAFDMRESAPWVWDMICNPATPVAPGGAKLGEERGTGASTEQGQKTLVEKAIELAASEDGGMTFEAAFKKVRASNQAQAEREFNLQA